MTRIESDNQRISGTYEDVRAFLTDLRNYGQLMPSMVSDFQASETEADFNIAGLGNVHVSLEEDPDNNAILLHPSGKLPFEFELVWELKDAEGRTDVKAVAHANLNMFMKMMAEPQLRKFLQAQADTLSRYFNSREP